LSQLDLFDRTRADTGAGTPSATPEEAPAAPAGRGRRSVPRRERYFHADEVEPEGGAAAASGRRGPDIDWAATLNPDQLQAATHGDGPQLVLAGAGSGKTRVITYRIAWLIRQRGVDPRHIAAVTFTNKAAGEMRRRAEHLLGASPLGAFVGTFHRFALGLLRRYHREVSLPRDFAIFDTGDQLTLIKKALELEELAESAFPPRAVLSQISSAKNRLVSTEGYEAAADDFYTRRVALVYRRYQGLLREAAAVDFDDMLFQAVQLFVQHPEIETRWRERLRHLLVDEFQDTNLAQLELVKHLTGPEGNLTAVGDEDQGIYRWRGAELENILDFERHFHGATLRKLEQNYRSTQTILDASGALVEHNVSRRGKRLWTDAGQGEPIRVYRAADEGDEARWILEALEQLRGDGVERRDMAILVRTHAQTRVLEEELLRRGVPYTLVGGVRFYDRAEIKDLVAYLRVLRNPRDAFSLQRIVNTPARGIGSTTLTQLEAEADDRGILTWDALLEDSVLERIPARGANALRSFRDLILDLQGLAEERTLPALLEALIERSGYAAMFREKGDADSDARLENIAEFVSAAGELADAEPDLEPLESLTAFLDHVSLTTDLDGLVESEGGISLMTLHSAKGLEFPVVVVAGLEEGILPHFNSQGAMEDIEEERRLLYVGMTRAERWLYLTCCRRRRVAGRYQDQEESEFLGEIPERFLEIEESPRGFADDARSRDVYRFFQRDAPAHSVSFASRDEDEPETGDAAVTRGARVRHPTLGRGSVMSLEGSGDDARITVYFERWGKRKLVARYAKLEVDG
jgi:DNA helicase-2/ATP-dependent DNA helicase PcrA